MSQWLFYAGSKCAISTASMDVGVAVSLSATLQTVTVGQLFYGGCRLKPLTRYLHRHLFTDWPLNFEKLRFTQPLCLGLPNCSVYVMTCRVELGMAPSTAPHLSNTRKQ